MYRRSTFRVPSAFQSNTDSYAKNQEAFQPRDLPLRDVASNSDQETDDLHDDIGRLMSTAFFSTDIDPDKIQYAISSKTRAKDGTVDKRIVAVAIALVFLIFIIDLMVQWI